MQAHPAYYVLDVVEKFRKVQDTASMHSAWRMVLDVRPDGNIWKAISDFKSLIDSVAAQIIEEEDDDDTHAVNAWKKPLTDALQPQAMAEGWYKFKSSFDSRTIALLKSHARILASEKGSSGFAQESLDSAISSLQSALDILIKSDIDDGLKNTIVLRIEQLISAIRRHQFMSPQAVDDQMKALLGEVAFAPSEQKQKLRDSGFINALKPGLEVVAACTQITQATAPAMIAIAATFAQYIP